MYFEIDPSGCCERNGMKQVKFSFYLDHGNVRHHEHNVMLPVHPKEGYTGAKKQDDTPEDIEHFKTWVEALPKKNRNNPFHNHFVRVPLDTTDAELMELGAEYLQETYSEWAEGKTPNPRQKPIKKK